MQIRCVGVALATALTYRSALEEVVAKSAKAMLDILHNSNYNDDFLSSKITTLKIVRSELIITIM